MVGEIAKLMVSVGAETSAMNQGLANAEQRVQGFTGTVKSMIGAGGMMVASVAAGMAAVGLAVNQALEFGEAGARLVNLENSFNSFTQSAGQSGDAVLASMKQMSQGMMSESALMEQYNRAFLLIGADTAAQMPQLIQLATAASAAGMGDFQFLLQSLVTGIGRLSPMILDNLGLTVSLEGAYARYGATIGVAGDKLSKTQQQQALLNEIMSQSEAKFGNLDLAAQNMAGKGIAQLKTGFQELSEEIKMRAMPTIDEWAGKVAAAMKAATPGTPEAFQAQLDKIDAISKGQYANVQLPGEKVKLDPTLVAITDAAKRAGQAIAEFWGMATAEQGKPTAQFEALRIAMGGVAEESPKMQAQMIAAVNAMNVGKMSATEYANAYQYVAERSAAGAAEMARLRDAAIGLAATEQRTAEAAMYAGVGINASAAAARAAVSGYDTAAASAKHLADMIASIGGGSLGAAKAQAYGMATQRMGYAGEPVPVMGQSDYEKMLEDGQNYYKQQSETAANTGKEIYDIQQAGAKGTADMYKDMAGSLLTYANNYKSAIQGLMTATGGGAAEAKGFLEQMVNDAARKGDTALLGKLGRADEWDEYARRQASVMQDTKRNDDERIAAAKNIQAFYAGQLPGEINWEAVAGGMKGQVGEKNNWQSILAQAPGELAKFGVNASSADVMKAFGFDGAAMGLDGADQFMTSFAQNFDLKSAVMNAGGKSIYGKIIAGLNAELKDKGDGDMKSLLAAILAKIAAAAAGSGGKPPPPTGAGAGTTTPKKDIGMP